VYYFHGEDNELLYVGKSKNIRKRVLSHFANDLKSERSREMKMRTHDITWELTGSELIALLLESEEIKTRQPEYNRAGRRSWGTYGIYTDLELDGYLQVKMDRVRKGQEPLISHIGRLQAERIMLRMIEEFELCDLYCGRQKEQRSCFRHQIGKCRGACAGKESPEDYNARVEEALRYFRYHQPNFFILGKGRRPGEESIVCIEEGRYRGFGFFDPEHVSGGPEDLKNCLTAYEDNRDVQRLISSWIGAEKPGRVVPF
jgi:DNA polymerase-3 subunit epsilon